MSISPTTPTATAIAEIDLFSGLGERERTDLARLAVPRSVEKGELVFLEGDEAEGFYAVVEGSVRIYKAAPSGREHVLHVFGPGEAFGEVAVFEGKRFPASAQALTPSSVFYFPRAGFHRLISTDPDLALSMLALLSGRLRQFVRKIEELTLKDVPARLAAHLLLLRSAQNTDTLTLDLPKSQMALYLGTVPETLSRILAKLSESGLIEVSGKTVSILDADRLAEVAEEGL